MSESPIDVQIEREFKHNFIVNFLDGTFFWAGASFLTAATILPLYVSHFTDSKLLIGLISAISTAGWMLPQLFTANSVERMPQKKVVPVVWGLFSERLPVFLLALSAWMFAADSPELALIFFYITYTWHAVGAGFIAVGWQDMIAKVIPRDRRGRFFGVTNFMGTAMGMFGALIAAWLLKNYEFPTGYVIIFGLAALLIFISWIFLAQTREPALLSTKTAITQRDYWRGLPLVIQEDHNYRHYLISRVIVTFSGMAGGFFAVYANQKWNLPDSQAGLYTIALLLGQATSNLMFGMLSDRRGHKIVLEISVLCVVLATGLALVATEPIFFFVVFMLVGCSTAGFILSGISIAFEFSNAEVRPTYIGLNNTINGVAYMMAPLLGAILAEQMGYHGLFIVALIIGILGFLLMHYWVNEPRFSK